MANAVTGSPLSLHLAEKDDYTPIGQCQDYARWFETKGAPISVTVYQGAYHMFDTPGTVIWSPMVQTFGNCAVEANLDNGQWKCRDTNEILKDTNEINAYYKGCIKGGFRAGAHVGGDRKARQQVFENVQILLKSVFKMEQR